MKNRKSKVWKKKTIKVTSTHELVIRSWRLMRNGWKFVDSLITEHVSGKISATFRKRI